MGINAYVHSVEGQGTVDMLNTCHSNELRKSMREGGSLFSYQQLQILEIIKE